MMAKGLHYTSVQAVKQPHDNLAAHDTVAERQPSVLKLAPWTAILAVVLALGCGIAAISLALSIDGKPLEHWTINGYVVQPAVLLSVLATIANALLVFSFTKGATISWYDRIKTRINIFLTQTIIGGTMHIEAPL
jgi:hypothetical protein